jgi:plasmid stability protein
MTLSIELPDEQKTVLAAKARAHGISLEEYVRQLLAHDLMPDWLQKSWDSARAAGLDQLSMEEIDAEIAAARKARRDARLQPGS